MAAEGKFSTELQSAFVPMAMAHKRPISSETLGVVIVTQSGRRSKGGSFVFAPISKPDLLTEI